MTLGLGRSTQRWMSAVVLLLFGFAPAAPGQAPGSGRTPEPANLSGAGADSPFDVASIKPANPATRPGRAALALRPVINTSSTELSASSATLKDLVAAAYGLEDYQVWGGPLWMGSDRFEVSAKSAKPASREQLLFMLRSLLKERCKLATHIETKEMAVYALTVPKNANLQNPKPGDQARPELDHLAKNWDLPALARFLSRFGADKPVIDASGLSKEFHLDLDMNDVIRMAQVDNSGPTNESMFDAMIDVIKRQTGLRVVTSKAPIEVIVIDQIERPSAN